jgi:hypothetical protein
MSCGYVHDFCARPCLFKSSLCSPLKLVIPKGRVALPREPKAKPKDKVLVFADGKAAEDARRAGADIVGGAELAEGVRHWLMRRV